MPHDAMRLVGHERTCGTIDPMCIAVIETGSVDAIKNNLGLSRARWSRESSFLGSEPVTLHQVTIKHLEIRLTETPVDGPYRGGISVFIRKKLGTHEPGLTNSDMSL